MCIYKELEEWGKRNEVNEAILAEIHGITDVAEYYDLYWPHTELAPCQFAIEVYRSISGWYSLEKDVRKGYYYDDHYDWGSDYVAPTEGEGWSFEGDKSSLEDQIEACYGLRSPAFLYEEQADLMDDWRVSFLQKRGEGLFAPEW